MPPRRIYTVAEVAEADRAAIAAGTPGLELMERAGAAVAEAILARFEPQSVAVLCGPGGNGGDGYVVARLLKAQGWDVWVERLAAPAHPDTQVMAARWDGETQELDEDGRTPALVVDALFGAGLTRPLEGEAARLARASETMSGRIVAIDLPSGLSGDTGKVVGDAAFCATLTVTFHARKPAHVLEPGAGRCGEVVVADIGLAETRGDLFENTPDLWLRRFPW